MLELVQPMGSVLLSWLLLFHLFSGLGLLVLRLLGRALDSGWVWLDSFWLGWALALGVMQVWHFFLPVNDALALLFALAAALLLWSRRRSLCLIAGRLARNRPFLLVFALLALWMSNRALGMPTAYDTGYRDIQAVAWIDAYAIVPGLGNLFSSLAFNHSVYLYDALLDTSIWSGRSYHIALGLLLLVYAAFALRASLALYRSMTSRNLRWSWIFASLTIPFVLFQTVGAGGITRFLTDTMVDIVGFLTLIYLLEFLQFWRPDGGKRDYLLYRLAIIILTGFTIKQSYVVFGFAVSILAIVVWLRRGGYGASPHRIPRAIIGVVLAALALLLPWMGRGLVTSGYIAFPQPVGRVEADWTVPAEWLESRLHNLAADTRQFGAEPDHVLDSWDWLGPWLGRFARNIFPTMLPTLISIAALALYCAGVLRYRRQRQALKLHWLALSPLIVMLVFWFVTVPDDKYVRYIFWCFASLSITLAVLAWQGIAWRRRVFAVFCVLAFCLAYVLFMIIRHGEVLIPAGPQDGFHARTPPEYQRFETDQGLIVHVPIGVNQCWNIPLPCTPFPHAAISARVPGELRHGFRFQPSEEKRLGRCRSSPRRGCRANMTTG